MKSNVLVIVLLIFMVISLSSCSENEIDQRLNGTWVFEDEAQSSWTWVMDNGFFEVRYEDTIFFKGTYRTQGGYFYEMITHNYGMGSDGEFRLMTEAEFLAVDNIFFMNQFSDNPLRYRFENDNLFIYDTFINFDGNEITRVDKLTRQE